MLEYPVAAGDILLAWLMIRLVKSRLINVLQRPTENTTSIFDDLIIRAVSKFILPFFFCWSTSVSSANYRSLLPRLEKVLLVAMIAVVIYFIIGRSTSVFMSAFSCICSKKTNHRNGSGNSVAN